MSQEEMERQLIEAMNRLFITYRQHYILQNPDGSYTNTSKSKYNFKLTDSVVLEHLRMKKTIGVFSNPYSAIFMCLDLDMGDYTENERQSTAKEIIQIICDVGISKDYIHIVYSGSKGFHIYVFFDDVVKLHILEDFYTYILFNAKLEPHILERRPLPNLGLKIPLSIHRKTNKLSYFVDESFQQITDPLHITSIKQFPAWRFNEIVSDCKLTKEKIEQYQKNLKFVQMSANGMRLLPEKDVIDIEESGLKYKSTRNFCSNQLAMYYMNNRIPKEDALKRLNDWILRQDNKYFNSSLSFCLKENKKIIECAYKKTPMSKTSGKFGEVKLFKTEINRIKEIPDKNCRKVLLSMFIHDKIYSSGEEFYMTYEQIMKHTGIKNRNTISKSIKYLSDVNEIKTVYNGNYKDRVPNLYNLQLGKRSVMYKLIIEKDDNYIDKYNIELCNELTI